MVSDEEAAARVVFVTAPAQEAETIAQRIVSDRLAACVNILPGVRSVYRWAGEVRTDPEALLMIKTTTAAVFALERTIRDIHSYDVPEFLVLPVESGGAQYLEWLHQEVGAKEPE